MRDRVLASLGLLLCSPVLSLISVAIVIEDGWPIVFRQVRVGRFGKDFVLFKFRSMRQNQTGKSITVMGDTRVTRCGKVLRKFKLDELLQLWNVVRGEMGLIGPRPEVPQFVVFGDPEWNAVLQVKPGITDLATLAYRNEEKILSGYADIESGYREVVLPAKLALNREYLKRRSAWSDIKLLALTVLCSIVPADFSPQQITQVVLPASRVSRT